MRSPVNAPLVQSTWWKARCLRVEQSMRDRLQAMYAEAGVPEMASRVAALCDRVAGRPWPQVDYRLLDQAAVIERRAQTVQNLATRLAEKPFREAK